MFFFSVFELSAIIETYDINLWFVLLLEIADLL